MKKLMLCDCPVRADEDGYFCITDMWIAMGREHKNRPFEFLRNDKTKEYIGILEKAGNPAFYTKIGRNGGTYCCRHLAYEFVGWSKAEFKELVYQILDAYYSGKLKTEQQWQMQQELQEHVLQIRVSEQIGSFHGKGLYNRKQEKHQLESKSAILLEKYQYQLVFILQSGMPWGPLGKLDTGHLTHNQKVVVFHDRKIRRKSPKIPSEKKSSQRHKKTTLMC